MCPHYWPMGNLKETRTMNNGRKKCICWEITGSLFRRSSIRLFASRQACIVLIYLFSTAYGFALSQFSTKPNNDGVSNRQAINKFINGLAMRL